MTVPSPIHCHCEFTLTSFLAFISYLVSLYIIQIFILCCLRGYIKTVAFYTLIEVFVVKNIISCLLLHMYCEKVSYRLQNHLRKPIFPSSQIAILLYRKILCVQCFIFDYRYFLSLFCILCIQIKQVNILINT